MKFSIIIPVYNVAPYLRECLDSVLAQTYTDWEAICVDDGSTDGSGAILDEYAAKDSRFRVIHQKNAGVSAARNVALQLVSGDWTCFVDADDCVEPCWLAAYYEAIVSHPDVEMVRSSWKEIWSDQTVMCDNRTDLFDVVLRDVEMVQDAWTQFARCSFMVVAAIRSERLSGVRFHPDVRYREDALFLFDVIQKCSGLLTIRDYTYCYRKDRPGSANSIRRSRESNRLLMKHYQHIWRRLSQRNKTRVTRSASTNWLMKDVRQWYVGCVDKTRCDMLKAWMRVWGLVLSGAIVVRAVGGLSARIRFIAFLLTGCLPLLFISKVNLIRFVKRRGNNG